MSSKSGPLYPDFGFSARKNAEAKLEMGQLKSEDTAPWDLGPSGLDSKAGL